MGATQDQASTIMLNRLQRLPHRFRPRWLPFGLGIQISLIVTGILIGGLLVLTALLLALQREQFLQSVQGTTAHISSLVEASLEEAMLHDDRPLAGRILQSEASRANIEGIRVLDVNGVVRASSSAGELGRQYNASYEECRACHTGANGTGNHTSAITTAGGREMLTSVTIIRNRPACASCHGDAPRVLGLLIVDHQLTELRAYQSASMVRLSLTAAGSFLLLITLLSLALRRAVSKPIRQLATGLAEVGQGNLDYPMGIQSHNEIGELSAAFHEMRQHLKALRLETEQRSEQLSTLNEIALSAGQLLDPGEVLDFALDTVVSKLGMGAGQIYLFDEAENRFTLRRSQGLSEQQCRQIEQLRQQGCDLTRRVAESGDEVLIPDLSADARMRHLWEGSQPRSYVNVPLKSRGRVVGAMGLVTRAGMRLAQEDIEALKTMGHVIGIALENALLLAETRCQQQQAVSLYQLGLQISDSLELDQVLQAIAEATRQVLAADLGVLGLWDETRGEVVVKATAGACATELAGLRFPLPPDIGPASLATDSPLVIDSWKPDLPEASYARALQAEGAASLIVARMRQGDQLLGMLGAISRRQRRFTAEDGQLLQRFVQQATIAVQHAQLYRQVRYLSALEERVFLAREMHDRLAQTLAFINLKAALVAQQLGAGQAGRAQADLAELKQATQAAYTEAREAIFSLRATTALAGSGFLPTLRQYLADYQADFGLDARLIVEGEPMPRLAEDAGLQVMRIIQEALTNVRKHARTGQVRVRLSREDGHLRIGVEDDGQGFVLPEVRGSGGEQVGLQIMRERAASVGATLEIASQPGEGTKVVIWLPVGKGEGNSIGSITYLAGR